MRESTNLRKKNIYNKRPKLWEGNAFNLRVRKSGTERQLK